MLNRIEREFFRAELLREHWVYFAYPLFCQITLQGFEPRKKVQVHAHHIFPVAFYPKRKLDITNGVLLEIEFHKLLHQNHALQDVSDALKGYVEDNFSPACRYYLNLVLPNGSNFVD